MLSAGAVRCGGVQEVSALVGVLQEQGIPPGGHYPILLNLRSSVRNDLDSQPVGDGMTEMVISQAMYHYLSHVRHYRVIAVLLRTCNQRHY